MKNTEAVQREMFWSYLEYTNKDLYLKKRKGRQNDQVTDIRITFNDWKDFMYQTNQMSEELFENLTL